jgi:O-antigen/teichoic acid export membrane protein
VQPGTITAWCLELFARFPAKRGLASLALHASRLSLQVVSSILIARTLSRAEFGSYSFVISIVSIAAVAAQFGLDILLVRETAAANAMADGRAIGQIWRWAARTARPL